MVLQSDSDEPEGDITTVFMPSMGAVITLEDSSNVFESFYDRLFVARDHCFYGLFSQFRRAGKTGRWRAERCGCDLGLVDGFFPVTRTSTLVDVGLVDDDEDGIPNDQDNCPAVTKAGRS